MTGEEIYVLGWEITPPSTATTTDERGTRVEEEEEEGEDNARTRLCNYRAPMDHACK